MYSTTVGGGPFKPAVVFANRTLILEMWIKDEQEAANIAAAMLELMVAKALEAAEVAGFHV